jgi:hypothetical protein
MRTVRTAALTLIVVALVVGLITVHRVDATPVTFSSSSGELAASAVFDIVSGNLQVTLRNTSMMDVVRPVDVLTAVFFSAKGTLTPISALLPSGSVALFGPDGGGNVGGEWAYASGLSGAPGGANSGISSTGLDLFGAANFSGPNLYDPEALDGLNYGITSAGDDPAIGNAKVTGGVPLIKDSVVFTLGAYSGFSLTDISDVTFQYGTSLSEVQVPEPGTLLLLGSGLIGLVAYRRIRG